MEIELEFLLKPRLWIYKTIVKQILFYFTIGEDWYHTIKNQLEIH